MDIPKLFSDLMLRFLMYDHIVIIALFGAISILYFNRHSFSEDKYHEYMIMLITAIIITAIIILIFKNIPGFFIL